MAAGLGALAACAAPPPPPSMVACKTLGGDDSGYRRRVQSCTEAIAAGVAGANLEAAYRLRGEAYLGLADAARAISDLDQAIRLDPADSQAFVSRSIADYDRDDFPAALRDATQAIELAPDAPNGWSARGFAYLGERDDDMALADFADAIRRNRYFISAYAGSAAAHRGKGDDDAAIADYTQLLSLDGGNVEALSARAETYAEKQDFDHAAADIDKAIQIAPGDARLYETRSDLNLRMGDAPRAIADADKALLIKPNDPSALNAACWMRAVGDRLLGVALELCKRSLAIRPGDEATLDSLAFTDFRLGKLDEAMAGYDAALAKDPRLPSSLFMRGVLKARRGDHAGAAADLAAAKTLDPKIADQYAGYGVKP